MSEIQHGVPFSNRIFTDSGFLLIMQSFFMDAGKNILSYKDK